MEQTVLAFDIGGTWLRVAEVDRSANIMWEDRSSPAHEYAQDISLIQRLVDRQWNGEVVAAAFACPGPLDFHTGEVLAAANLGWEHVFPGEDLAKSLGVPVKVENDADCAALAEATYGEAKGCELLVWYGLGTGVGAGVVDHGHIFHGAFDPEFGHQFIDPVQNRRCTLGHQGCLESLISGSGLELAFGSIEDVPEDQWKSVVPRYLGWAMANATLFLSPDAIVVGGGVVDHQPEVVGPAETVMKAMLGSGLERFLPHVYRSTLRGNVGLLGAAARAWQLPEETGDETAHQPETRTA